MSETDPSWNLYAADTLSYFLPYQTSSFGSLDAGDPTILVGVDGQTLDAPLDTGSRGASIPQASVPDITQGPNDPSGYLFYWSRGRKVEGYWHDLTLTFPNGTCPCPTTVSSSSGWATPDRATPLPGTTPVSW